MPCKSEENDALGEQKMKLAIETIGWVAAVMMLCAYVMLTLGQLSARSGAYHWLNILSGAGFIINSGWNGAYPSACINVIWVAIGLYGVAGQSLRNDDRRSPDSTGDS
jgi:formate hydrogenlyase subunit 3/multisubunit Na+/H+ antiporter MnhD subunit